MSHASKLAMLIAFALSAGPNAASAHPAILGSAPGTQAAAPIVKAGCYYEGCDYPRWHCWRPRCGDGYEGYRRPRYYGPEGDYYHSRYYSHYRWGSYHRYWRPWCCGYSGWGD
ncbi:MAG: hypothetical protein ACLPX9_01470 [Rhodomicrobium sp.]